MAKPKEKDKQREQQDNKRSNRQKLKKKLGIKENYDNLFYLTRYSIENYLCNKNSIYEVIREKKPNLKNDEIDLQATSLSGDNTMTIAGTNSGFTYLIIRLISKD